MNNATNQTLEGPTFTFTGVRLTGLTVKSFFLRTFDLGIGTSKYLNNTMSGTGLQRLRLQH
ncbi:hypothetical protein MMSP_0686 [Mycobacterium sp. 012931]|nr:hypothetical protein MMSP_0686 [Mycobacterium sp. 012931]EPQ72282.1 hypothetical protein MMEU_3664 [Mycobacterium marinum str. Europe]MBC9862550.1 hypothetical protein [Mycobacterium pseudoshottsii]